MTRQSDSDQFKNALHNLIMALLSNDLINARRHSLATKSEMLTEPIVNILEDKCQSICFEAFRKLGSERQMCVLIKMLRFVNGISAKNKHKVTEKAIKKWRAEECEEEAQRERTIAEFREAQFGEVFKESMKSLIVRNKEKCAHLLSFPGAKKRLALLVGSEKRFEQIVKNELEGKVLEGRNGEGRQRRGQ